MRDDRDSNGKNAFHRAASEHNLNLVKEMCEIDPVGVGAPAMLRMWINSETRYGETPLLISAMLLHRGENEGLNKDREVFIDYLLANGALVNTCNNYTLWTPATWAARHGDEALLEKLLGRGAMPFTPDVKGYFPIDYAGKFEHYDIVKRLVEVSIEKFTKLKECQTSANSVGRG